MKIQVSQIKMEGHMSFTNSAILKQSCTIENENHILKGKKIIIETYTPKKEGVYGEWGKPEKIFYLEDGKKSYKTLNGFLKSIGFDKITDKQ